MPRPNQPRSPQVSRLYRLIEDRLEGTLADFVGARRPATSWAAIADELHEKTGIEVSWESLRRWFVDRIEVTVTVLDPVGAPRAS